MGRPDEPAEIAWQAAKRRHRDWWGMSTPERLRVLSYDAGYDDGYADGREQGYASGYLDGIEASPTLPRGEQ